MPELPEVEIVRQSLHKKIKKKSIKKVIIRNRKLRFKIPRDFESFLKNKKIIEVSRFSKYLIIHFQNEDYCLIHLGMSGTIHIIKNKKNNLPTNTSFYNSPNLPKNHNHIEFFFKNIKLIYNDPRRFGYFQFFSDFDSLKKKFKSYGPEPFNRKFNSKYLISYFKKKDKSIKNFLLDQNFVSGIGNIYSNEILFYCKINPLKPAKKINNENIHNISKYSKLVLNLAIKYGGSSIRDFKNIKGVSGSFQNEFKVYDREKKNCPRKNCRSKISKIFISKRSTFFCKSCQK